MVRMSLKYIPPAGKTGGFVAKLFGRDANAEIAEDLNRLKSFLDTGQLPEEESASWPRAAMDGARQAADATNAYVHENTWTMIGSVAIASFALGFILGQRKVGFKNWI